MNAHLICASYTTHIHYSITFFFVVLIDCSYNTSDTNPVYYEVILVLGISLAVFLSIVIGLLFTLHCYHFKTTQSHWNSFTMVMMVILVTTAMLTQLKKLVLWQAAKLSLCGSTLTLPSFVNNCNVHKYVNFYKVLYILE